MNTISTPSYEAQGFDAATWLADFGSVGGSCWVSPNDGQLKSGWQIEGRPQEDHLRARELFNEVNDAPDRDLRFELIERELRRRCGPDLTEAEPLAVLLPRLRPLRNTFAVEFVRACKASGIDLTVRCDQQDGERLLFGVACDDQEYLRRERCDALMAVLARSPKRRQAVVDVLNMVGRFVDDRPFSSIKQAAAEYLAAGGRIYILPDGACEETIPLSAELLEEEAWNGYKIRRLQHRYGATLRKRDARKRLAEMVRRQGKREGASIVWRTAQ